MRIINFISLRTFVGNFLYCLKYIWQF